MPNLHKICRICRASRAQQRVHRHVCMSVDNVCMCMFMCAVTSSFAIHTYAHMRKHLLTRSNSHELTSSCTRMYIHTYTYIHVHTRIHACTYTRTDRQTRTHAQTHTHRHTDTDTQTQTQTQTQTPRTQCCRFHPRPRKE